MYAVIDVETTGGSPANDRIIEIAVIICDGKKTIDSFHTLVNPHRSIDPYVTKLTGISSEMVADAPAFADIHQRILEITNETIFVAHNVRFDFGMIRQEYKRLGIDFHRRQLDTVSLARKLLPGYPSYSLGNICDSLGICINNRHRAFGDAEATVKLLELILAANAAPKYIEIELNGGIDPNLLPPYLSQAEIEKLPEDAGVFYYRDETGKIIYLDGVKNIRKKVIAHITSAQEAPEKKRMFELLRSIDYELSGNELVAKLIAQREIKAHLPEFNKKPRQHNLTHAIYLTQDEQGFNQLKIHAADWKNGEAILRFPSKPSANKTLVKIIHENNLHSWFATRAKLKEAEQIDAKKLKNYNAFIEKAVRRYLYRSPNFFIIGEGIHPESNSVIWVENNEYQGYGFFDPELTPATPANLKEVVKPEPDDPEIQKIIRMQLRKMKTLKVITY